MRIARALLLSAASALPLLAQPALASQTVDTRRPAPRDGIVSIENAAGSIRVIGWDRAEVAVTGSIGRGASGLSVTGKGQRTRVEVEVEGNPQSVHSDLEVHVPGGSRVEVEGFSSSISVADVTGGVSAESVNGSITVTGSAKDVHAETVNGSVQVSGPARRVHAESVNGAVTVQGASGELEANSVNGHVAVTGGSFSQAKLESVNGGVRFEGALGDGAWLSAETVSGSVDLLLPADTGADFTVSTFSGAIRNELGPSPQRVGRYTTEKELRFTTGSGKGRITVHTLSGSITLRKQ